MCNLAGVNREIWGLEKIEHLKRGVRGKSCESSERYCLFKILFQGNFFKKTFNL